MTEKKSVLGRKMCVILEYEEWLNYLFFFVDTTEVLAELNLYLQGMNLAVVLLNV